MDEKSDVVVAEVVPAQAQPEVNSTSNTKTINLADPILRIVAFIIDMVVFIVFTTTLQFIFGLSSTLPLNSGVFNGSNADVANIVGNGIGILSLCIIPLINILFAVAYLVVVPSMLWQGQTLGMKLLSLKFTKENGTPVTTMDMFLRSLFLILYNVPLLSILVCCLLPVAAIANLIMIFTDPKNQTLFDKMAGTIVIKE